MRDLKELRQRLDVDDDLDEIVASPTRPEDTRHSHGCAQADLARQHWLQGEANKAIGLLVEALRHLDREQDPAVFDRAVDTLALYLRECDYVKARIETLVKAIRIERHGRGTIPWAQHRWLEGLVLKRRGRSQRALLTLRSARRQLLAHGAVRQAALVTVDLVGLCLNGASRTEARRLARQALRALKADGLGGRVVAPFRAYVRALDQEAPQPALEERARAALLGAA